MSAKLSEILVFLAAGAKLREILVFLAADTYIFSKPANIGDFFRPLRGRPAKLSENFAAASRPPCEIR